MFLKSEPTSKSTILGVKIREIFFGALDTSNYIMSEKSGKLGESSLHKFFKIAKF